jgi:hypothetical protein
LGFYRQHVNGRIYYNDHYSNAPSVHDAIGDKYARLNGLGSWSGWPASDEQSFPRDGRLTRFDNGAIYWWSDTGAIELGNVSVQYKALYCFGETDEWSAADEPQFLIEDWAGLALVALRQGDLETAETSADRAWQVCQGLGLSQADEVLASAARVLQTYLDHQPDPAAQTVYSQQQHHQTLWVTWQAQQKEGKVEQSLDPAR